MFKIALRSTYSRSTLFFTGTIILFAGLGLLLGVSFTTHSQASPNPVNGYITTKDGQRVLHLFGTHYEMGYAHGYLLGEDIMLMIEKYLIQYLLNNNVSGWDAAKGRAETKMQFGRFNDEVTGLYDGMVASGTDIRLDALGRDLTIGDLKVWIAMYDIGAVAPLCSSFSVWGDAAGPDGVLHARNMDFPYDTENGYAANKFLLIAYQPTGGQAYVVATWPGALAVGTGMNASGLAFTVNVAPGPQDNTYSRNDYMPTGLVFREALEDAAGSGDLLTQVWKIVSAYPRTRSFNAQFTQPTGRGEDVSIVIEGDALGLEIRHAVAPNPYVYATNHYIQRTNGNMEGSTKNRYQILTNELASLTTTGDRQVSLQEAQGLLQELAISWPTILSVYMRPERLYFDIAFAQTSGRNPVNVSTAPFVTPVHYTWQELFENNPAITPTDTPS